jgi:hypothetical protein
MLSRCDRCGTKSFVLEKFHNHEIFLCENCFKKWLKIYHKNQPASSQSPVWNQLFNEFMKNKNDKPFIFR